MLGSVFLTMRYLAVFTSPNCGALIVILVTKPPKKQAIGFVNAVYIVQVKYAPSLSGRQCNYDKQS